MRTLMGRVLVRIALMVVLTLIILPITVVTAPAVSLDDILKKDIQYQQFIKNADLRKAEVIKQYHCTTARIRIGGQIQEKVTCTTKDECLATCKQKARECEYSGYDRCSGRSSSPFGQTTRPSQEQIKTCSANVKAQCQKTGAACEADCQKIPPLPLR